jgi:hypothetical protein
MKFVNDPIGFTNELITYMKDLEEKDKKVPFELNLIASDGKNHIVHTCEFTHIVSKDMYLINAFDPMTHSFFPVMMNNLGTFTPLEWSGELDINSPVEVWMSIDWISQEEFSKRVM